MTSSLQLVAAKNWHKPDNAQFQVLCEIQKETPVSSFWRFVLCFGIPKSAGISSEIDWFDVETRVVGGRNPRTLVKVVSRKPRALQPYPDKAPAYLIAYVTELFECGHEQDFNFLEEVEPLVAKRRVCQECSEMSGEKKPAASVPAPQAKRSAA